MHTPKFPSISSSLQPVLSAGSFAHIWKNKIRRNLQNSPLRDPIDHFDFHLEIGQNARGLSTKIKDGRYSPSSHKRYRVEKSKGLCRQLVSPTPEDCMVLQALSDYLFNQISKAQPTSKAYFLPSDNKFNQKFEELAAEQYGSLKAWLDFQKRLFEFTDEYKFVVITDIANYYDFINFAQLRNVISSITKEHESIIDILIYVLSGLSWQPDYMPRNLTGLPQIDIDAPRLLAHAFLFEVDSFIQNEAGLEHVRFMDDIDIGANDISSAKRVLRDIDLIMQSRQIRLNSGKTKILTAEEARRHFCIKENHLLTKWQQQIDRKKKLGLSLARDQKRLTELVRRGLRKGRFDSGNGEKILKRLLTTATKTGAQIRLQDLESIIKLRPGSRANAFWHLAHRTLGLREAKMLQVLILRPTFVDDASLFELTRCLMQAKVKKDARISAIVRSICDYLEDYSEYGVILAHRLALRFLTPGQIVHFTGNKRAVWQPDVVLGRFMGAALPFVAHAPKELRIYRNSIQQSNNIGAETTMGFFDSLMFDQRINRSVKSYCLARNPTLPLGANFEKISMLAALWRNVHLTPAERVKIRTQFPDLVLDPTYKRFF